MKLSRYAKTPVRRRDFWLAVVVGLLIVSGIGLHVTQAWHVPDVSRWLWSGILLALWAVAMIQYVRYGRAAFPWQRAASLLGYTLFAVGHLWSNPPPAVSWASGAGFCMSMAVVVSQYFVLGKQREGEAGPSSV